jgi:hypothetical protein
MHDDPIVEEVRRARDAYAARFNYDIEAMCRDLRERDRMSGQKVVNLRQANSKSAASVAGATVEK